MHTTVHAPRTKGHALIFGPERQMLKPLYACAVAESILTWPRTKKAWSPKIGGNDQRAGSVELGTEWNARGFAYSNPDRNVELSGGEGPGLGQGGGPASTKVEFIHEEP